MKKSIARLVYVFSILTVLFLQVGIQPVAASVTFVVNSTVDAPDAIPGNGVCETITPGQCTLRAAVQESNALGGGVTVTLPAGTYTLTTGGSIADSGDSETSDVDLDVTKTLTINGAGMSSTIIDANGLDRIFNVKSTTLQINNLTIRNGNSNPGGAILVNGSAVITSVAFNNNQAPASASVGTGGAVYVASGSATISKSVFTSNLANYGGGAVATASGSATFAVSDSTFSSNYGGFGGGALYPNGGPTTVVRSTFVNNSATATTGSTGSVGGAIHSNAQSVLVENSTFVGNVAPHDAAIDSRIGAITVNNSTFYNNQNVGSVQFGSTMGSQPANGGSIAVSNSILYGPSTNNCSNVTDLGHNLSWPSGNNCPGTQADPQLAALADNGGLTQTMAITASSPAYNAGDNTKCAATDQRGVTRPQNTTCDIGAFELVYDRPQTGPTFTVNATNDNNGACTIGDCSLREAITAANAAPNGTSPDSIVFNLSSSAAISPASALPSITDPVSINGSNNLALNGANAGAGINGLTIAASNTTVSGLEITGFQGAGVAVISGSGNVIRNNSIHDNGGIGIDLGADGASFDHLGDASGPNHYQNFPILNLATSSGSSLRLVGSLTSLPSQTYTLDFYTSPVCDPSSFGEGKTYLGSFPVTTNASGWVNFDQTINVGGSEPNTITSTATGANGTSEFSYCRPVATPNVNWAQAQTATNGSTTNFYLTDHFQEKWFKFAVQPGATVQVTLTGQPGNALTLHSDPFLIYNQLINPQSAAALSAAAADDAFLQSSFLPSGTLPSGTLQSGYLPSGTLPSDTLPSGTLPSGTLPSGTLPSGTLPSGTLPYGVLPSGTLPSGTLPSGTLPSGTLPSGTLPSGTLPSGTLPSGTLPSGTLPSGTLPSGTLPSGTLDAYGSAARRSLLAVSMDPYASVQSITRATYDASGYMYIRVVGAFSLTKPFQVTVNVLGGSCNGIQPVPSNLAVMSGSPQGSGLQTLILTDSSRLKGTPTEIGTALSDLQSFAARSDVGGVVIDLHDSQYQRVAWANSQADQYPTCPFAKNMVATEIKSVVDAYRSANGSSLQYVVLAGGASVIPFYQVPDLAGLASEKGYVAPVAPNTPSEAGLKTGLVEGQDYYGSQTDFTQAGFTVPMPSLAVGRLVDTAADISTAIRTYVATNGVVVPHSSLVTGYDFVGDAAAAIATEMNAGTASTADTLIEAPGLPPTDPTAWTAGQLFTKLLAGNHDIVVLTGHFSAGNLLAADYSTGLSANDIAASTAPLNNVLVLALGCHSGYSIPYNDLLLNVSPNPDWAKVFLGKGAAGFVAASGYAYGDTILTEYGERLFVGLSQQLRTGNGPVSVGQALVAAKRQYIANTAQLTGIDQKTLVEMTLYGLPMMKINMPGQRLPLTSANPIVSSTTPFASGPAASTGLTSTAVTLSPVTNTNTVPLQNLATNSTVNTTYLSGADGVVANPYEPLFPKDIYNVTASGLVLRGEALYGATYADQTGIVPLTSAPTTELSVANLSYNTPVYYPGQIWMPNFSDALTGGQTSLVAIPAQFQSSAIGAIDGTLRAFSKMQVRLYYMPDNWPAAASASVKAAAVSAAPNILGANADVSGSNVNFRADITQDGSAGVQEAWILYTGRPGSPFYGQWSPLNLTQDSTDPTRWAGSLPLPTGADPADLLFMVEAVGGAGLTTLSTNLGAYYGIDSSKTTPVATTIQFQSPPSSGTYLQSASFSATVTTASQPVAGQVVEFSVGSKHMLATTDSNGNASVSLTLVVLPGSYFAQVSLPGSSSYLASSAATPFTVNKDATAIQVSGVPASFYSNDPDPIAATITDSSGTPLPGKSVFFIVHNSSNTLARSVIADYQGKTPLGDLSSLPAGSYTVDAYFSGTIPLSPTAITLSDDYYSPSKSLGSSLTLFAADSTPPTITATATTADGKTYTAGTWTNQTVTVHFTCADSGSGIASCPADQVFSSDGTGTASGTANDKAGNSASTTFGPIQVDKTGPTITAAISSGTLGSNGWYTSNVTVHFTCSDSGSGIPAGSCPADQVLSTEGSAISSTAQTVTDAVGNTSAPSNVVTVKIDKTKPTITAAISSGTLGQNGWYVSSVTVHFTCSDGIGSGIPTSGCPADQTLSTDGTGVTSTAQTVTDVAGNVSDPSNVVGVNIDQTKPTITAAIFSGTPGQNGWYTSDVTVRFTCSDAGSGIPTGSCPADQVLSTEGSAVASTAQTVTDAAGNISAPSNVVTVKIDKTRPTVTAAISAGMLGQNAWYTSNVTVHFTCSDTGSGLLAGSCPPDQVLSKDGTGVNSTAVTVTDVAGNVSAPSNVISVNIDQTKPTLNPVISPNPVILNGTATAAAGAADATSGLASQSCGPIVTTSAGPKTVTCSATDNAGNKNSVTVPYSVQYRFSGFLQPINDPLNPQCTSPCPVSVFRGGSTVPTKFQLLDANGNVVQAATTPIWVTPQKAGTLSASVNESVYTDSATSGTSFTWSTNQYIYEWGTKGFATGYYWRIGVQLDDGTTHYITVGLK